MTEVLAERYELHDELGSGGMGRVVRAHDRVLGRDVAVKLLHPELVRQPNVRERFLNEARAAASFTHVNAVAVHDTGTDGTTPYIVMELVRGHTLADEIARGPLPPERAADLASQILAALAEAHDRGLVHRDVKPANVLITDNGTVKLTDFGIAKSVTEVGGLTATGQVFGTPQYLSPEQAAGQPAIPASDVYAVGVVLYEMLAGVPPFTGDNPISVALAHREDPPPPLSRRRSGVPAKLRAVVDRALAKRPEDRYADAGEMRSALGGLPGATPTSPEALGRTAVMPAPTTAPPVASRMEPPPRRPRPTAPSPGRSPWMPVLVVALLLLGALALYAALGDRVAEILDDRPTEAPTEAETVPPVEEEPEAPEPEPDDPEPDSEQEEPEEPSPSPSPAPTDEPDPVPDDPLPGS